MGEDVGKVGGWSSRARDAVPVRVLSNALTMTLVPFGKYGNPTPTLTTPETEKEEEKEKENEEEEESSTSQRTQRARKLTLITLVSYLVNLF